MASTKQRPILLFGETYHHPNIFYRSSFLAPDPVVLVDCGGEDITLWVSRLEEGRARKEAKVGRVRCIEDLGSSEIREKAGNQQGGSPLLLQAVCREHGIRAVDVDADFPVREADALGEQASTSPLAPTSTGADAGSRLDGPAGRSRGRRAAVAIAAIPSANENLAVALLLRHMRPRRMPDAAPRAPARRPPRSSSALAHRGRRNARPQPNMRNATSTATIGARTRRSAVA